MFFLHKFESRIPKIIAALLILSGLFHVVMALLQLFLGTINPIKNSDIFMVTSFGENAGIFVGIILGFFQVIIGNGLLKRRRKSWILATIVLIILCINNLFFMKDGSAVFIYNIVMIILLCMTYRQFSIRSEVGQGYQQAIAWASVVFAVCYGVFGSYMIRDQFSSIKTLTDAFYFTIITYSTIGYGDIHPITQNAELFTISMVILGLGSFATMLTFLIGPMIDNRMKGVLTLMSKIAHIKDHVIICGYNPLAKALIKNYNKKNVPVVIIESDPIKLSEMGSEINKVSGITSNRLSFEEAGIRYSKSVICISENDSENILAMLTVREILDSIKNNDIKLIVSIEHEENIDRVKKLGTVEIVSPSDLIANAILKI